MRTVCVREEVGLVCNFGCSRQKLEQLRTAEGGILGLPGYLCQCKATDIASPRE